MADNRVRNRMRPNPKSEDVSRQFAGVLERVRAGTDLLDLDDVCAWDEDERVRKLGLPVAWRRGCTRIELVYYCAFLRQMSKLMRRKEGEGLAFELRLLVDRWVLRGFDRSLLEELICHCYAELCCPRQMTNDEARMTIEAQDPNDEPRRHEEHESGGGSGHPDGVRE